MVWREGDQLEVQQKATTKNIRVTHHTITILIRIIQVVLNQLEAQQQASDAMDATGTCRARVKFWILSAFSNISKDDSAILNTLDENFTKRSSKLTMCE